MESTEGDPLTPPAIHVPQDDLHGRTHSSAVTSFMKLQKRSNVEQTASIFLKLSHKRSSSLPNLSGRTKSIGHLLRPSPYSVSAVMGSSSPALAARNDVPPQKARAIDSERTARRPLAAYAEDSMDSVTRDRMEDQSQARKALDSYPFSVLGNEATSDDEAAINQRSHSVGPVRSSESFSPGPTNRSGTASRPTSNNGIRLGGSELQGIHERAVSVDDGPAPRSASITRRVFPHLLPRPPQISTSVHLSPQIPPTGQDAQDRRSRSAEPRILIHRKVLPASSSSDTVVCDSDIPSEHEDEVSGTPPGTLHRAEEEEDQPALFRQRTSSVDPVSLPNETFADRVTKSADGGLYSDVHDVLLSPEAPKMALLSVTETQRASDSSRQPSYHAPIAILPMQDCPEQVLDSNLASTRLVRQAAHPEVMFSASPSLADAHETTEVLFASVYELDRGEKAISDNQTSAYVTGANGAGMDMFIDETPEISQAVVMSAESSPARRLEDRRCSPTYSDYKVKGVSAGVIGFNTDPLKAPVSKDSCGSADMDIESDSVAYGESLPRNIAEARNCLASDEGAGSQTDMYLTALANEFAASHGSSVCPNQIQSGRAHAFISGDERMPISNPPWRVPARRADAFAMPYSLDTNMSPIEETLLDQCAQSNTDACGVLQFPPSADTKEAHTPPIDHFPVDVTSCNTKTAHEALALPRAGRSQRKAAMKANERLGAQLSHTLKLTPLEHSNNECGLSESKAIARIQDPLNRSSPRTAVQNRKELVMMQSTRLLTADTAALTTSADFASPPTYTLRTESVLESAIRNTSDATRGTVTNLHCKPVRTDAQVNRDHSLEDINAANILLQFTLAVKLKTAFSQQSMSSTPTPAKTDDLDAVGAEFSPLDRQTVAPTPTPLLPIDTTTDTSPRQLVTSDEQAPYTLSCPQCSSQIEDNAAVISTGMCELSEADTGTFTAHAEATSQARLTEALPQEEYASMTTPIDSQLKPQPVKAPTRPGSAKNKRTGNGARGQTLAANFSSETRSQKEVVQSLREAFKYKPVRSRSTTPLMPTSGRQASIGLLASSPVSTRLFIAPTLACTDGLCTHCVA